MAGLVAVLSDDSRTAISRAEVDALARAYEEVRGPGRVDAVSVGQHAHCVKIDSAVGVGIERDGDAWCATIGRLHAPRSRARATLDEMEGQFAAVRYDGGDHIEVFNDPFGMQALYVAKRDGRTYISTSAATLARHLRASADPLGAAMFLLAGRQFGPASHWQTVERLDPATVLRFSPDSASRATYWLPTIDRTVRGMSFGDTADHCARVILSAMESRLAGEPCVQADITGGYDSRLIAAALARLGVPFSAQTTGDWDDEDVRLGRAVAETGGFDWRHDMVPDDWRPGFDDLLEAAGWGDGALEVLQLSEVLQTQRRRAAVCGLVVTGGGGEHFGPSPWLHEFLRAGRSRAINFGNLMAMRSLTPIDFSVLRTDPRPTVDDYMRTVLSRYTRFLADELNTTQLDAVFVYRAVGHFGAYRSASEAYVETEIPVYYRDVFTAAFSADHRHRNRHKLHRAVISRVHPAMSALQTTHGGPAQRMRVNNAHRFAPYYSKLGRTALRKIRRRPASHATSDARRNAYAHAVQALRAQGLLDPKTMRSGGIYEPQRLEALVTAAQHGDFNSWTQLGRVITLELALHRADSSALSVST